MYDKQRCPYCKTINLVYLGDWSDNTSPNVEAGQCYQCSKFFLMSDEEDQKTCLVDMLYNNIDENEIGSEEVSNISLQLLNGKCIVIEGQELDLSAFLEKYAYSNKGEKC
jgi:hypothetical protein